MGRETDRRVRAPFPPRHEVLPPQEKTDTVLPSLPAPATCILGGTEREEGSAAPALAPSQGVPWGQESPAVIPSDARDRYPPGPRTRAAAPPCRCCCAAAPSRSPWGWQRVPLRAAALDGALSFMQG